MTLLEVNDLHVEYSGIRAVNGVSFSMEKGQFITLIGANGAGKSSIVKAIMGLVKPMKGEIILNDKHIEGVDSSIVVKQGIAYCPEGRRIFATMSVEENLKIGAYLRKDKQGIEDDLEKVYHYFPILKEKRNLPGESLSGGQQQMLAIGRSLMASPKLLIIDELTLGLAPIIIQDLTKILNDLNENGLAIILIEQNANVALKTADYGYVLETGNIILKDDTKELSGNDFIQKAYLGI
ncbi:ABC transporter ATP-binding protein [Oceanobacillus salinisoli]|uniref:ABC transporter ATP-binding protein n=1 Tax=Oceanobacillus salinisoli TaxID=2678611 RepID=UPI0012E327E4|nr:ABC transporter ATP-binding protein [Oceanobacillus salinisoli]